MELVYATGEQKRDGWTLDVGFLKNIQRKIESDKYHHYQLEDIENVLLAAYELQK